MPVYIVTFEGLESDGVNPSFQEEVEAFLDRVEIQRGVWLIKAAEKEMHVFNFTLGNGEGKALIAELLPKTITPLGQETSVNDWCLRHQLA